jgi:HEAT repeat protein
MLTPQQVIPFLRHDDEEVRQHATLYLAGAHDPSPATADDFWAAIDKVGQEHAGPFVDRLELLPQTDDSIRRTLEAIPAFPDYSREGLLRVLRSLDLDKARAHLDAIRSIEQVPADVVGHLEERLALSDEGPDALWDRLMKQAADLENKPLSEADALAAERLIEALARHPDAATDRTVALLRDESVRDWREVMAADLAGELRLQSSEAVDALIDKLRDQEADILWETAGEALVRVGTPLVVERLADRFAREDWGFRISAAGVLGRIKRPEAESALVRLLPGEPDKEVVTFLAASLLDLCPSDHSTLDTLRRLILDERFEAGTADLRSMLLAAGEMVGYSPPEASAWREQREADRKRWESGAADADGILAAVQSRTLRAEDLGPVGQIIGLSDARPLPPLRPAVRSRRESPGRRGASGYAPAQPARTFRRPDAKVGRNDPCPCGSGKKFKKCCMRD